MSDKEKQENKTSEAEKIADKMSILGLMMVFGIMVVGFFTISCGIIIGYTKVIFGVK